MRIPGVGGEVFKRGGGNPVNIPGGELFTACKQGLSMLLNGLDHLMI